jgi:hypothetical protein
VKEIKLAKQLYKRLLLTVLCQGALILIRSNKDSWRQLLHTRSGWCRAALHCQGSLWEQGQFPDQSSCPLTVSTGGVLAAAHTGDDLRPDGDSAKSDKHLSFLSLSLSSLNLPQFHQEITQNLLLRPERLLAAQSAMRCACAQ